MCREIDGNKLCMLIVPARAVVAQIIFSPTERRPEPPCVVVGLKHLQVALLVSAEADRETVANAHPPTTCFSQRQADAVGVGGVPEGGVAERQVDAAGQALAREGCDEVGGVSRGLSVWAGPNRGWERCDDRAIGPVLVGWVLR